MGIVELVFLALGVSMDAFAVSVCKGLTLRRADGRSMALCGLWFGAFQAAMPLIGYVLGSMFAGVIEAFDHWVAFGLLAIIGGNLLREAFTGGDEDESSAGDFSPKTMAVLAVATSIDALAVGVSFAFLGVCNFASILPPIGIIGFVSFALSLAGLMFGIRCGCGIARKLRSELWGGIILIVIGTKILIEHLFF